MQRWRGVYERIKFEDAAKLNSLDGLRKTDTSVMRMHSSNDTTVNFGEVNSN